LYFIIVSVFKNIFEVVQFLKISVIFEVVFVCCVTRFRKQHSKKTLFVLGIELRSLYSTIIKKLRSQNITALSLHHEITMSEKLLLIKKLNY